MDFATDIFFESFQEVILDGDFQTDKNGGWSQ